MENQNQKRKVLIAQIDIERLNSELSKPRKVPDSLSSWEQTPPSKEYEELLTTLLTLGRFIALRLNEGPETSESVVKRAVTMKMVIQSIIDFTFMDGYHRYGVVSEIMNDIYMKTGGVVHLDQRIVRVLNRVGKAKQEDAKKKVSYVT
jgi:hypothetical protein